MTIDVLTIEEGRGWGFTHEATITFADLVALANGNTGSFKLSVGALGTVTGNFVVDLETPFVFSDASILSCAITIGDTGSATTDLASTELASAGTTVNGKAGTSKVYNVAALQKTVFFTGTAAHNLNTATAGVVHILWTERQTTAFRKV